MTNKSPKRPPQRLKTQNRLIAAAIVGCYATVPAWAQLPSGMSAQFGTATQKTVGNVLTVATTNGINSNSSIIHWDSFSIDKGYTTYFAQPSASSSVLNRVVGTNPSLIYGTLSSNGRVWLINPNGITIGSGGVVNTAAFVASTLDVSNSNFLAGKLTFEKNPAAGSVVNQGTITTPSGGSVYLIGSNVSNEGIITTPQGETLLAAGETVDLVDTGTPGVKVEITGAAGNTTNLGQIVAEAGRIGMAGVIVRNSGILNASSVVNEGGRIFLRASQDTYVDGNGRIVATGTKGGQVEVTGNRVAVTDNAQIDASGTNGGGTILVGGDYQGKNPDVQNAQVTYFGPQAVLTADATDNGDGGKVIVWADDTTRAYGAISVRGGANGGDGGFVETSGHRYLDVTRAPDLSAPQGKGGQWLLDPEDITIVGGSTNSNITDNGTTGNPVFEPNNTGGSVVADQVLRTALEAGGTVTVDTTYGGGSAPGDITVDASANLAYINVGSGATLNLLADRNILVNSTISSTGQPLNMNLTADQHHGGNGSIEIGSNVSLVANGGNISLSAGSGITLDAGAKISTGNISDLTNGSSNIDIVANAAGTGYGGDFTMLGGSTLLASNNVSVTADSIALGSGSDPNGAVIKRVGNSGAASPSSVNLVAAYGGITLYGGSLIGESGGSYGFNANLAATGDIMLASAYNGAAYGGSIVTTGSVTLVAGWNGSGWDSGTHTWSGTPQIVGDTSGSGSAYLYGPVLAGGDLTVLANGGIQLSSAAPTGSAYFSINHAMAGATSSDCAGGTPDLCMSNGYQASFGAFGNLAGTTGRLLLLAQDNIQIRSNVGAKGNAFVVAGWNNPTGFVAGTTTPTAAAYANSTAFVSFDGATLFSPGSGNVTVLAPGAISIDSGSGPAGIDMNRGTLTVAANSLALQAASNVDSWYGPFAARIASNGDQYFTLGDASNAGSLTLTGSYYAGAYGGSASIVRYRYLGTDNATHYTGGGQNFTIYGGGSVVIQAGNGHGANPPNIWSGECYGGGCSSNYASIEDHASGVSGSTAYGGGQTFDFYGGGALGVYGGGAGVDNSAGIHSDGAQHIYSSGGNGFSIEIDGGTGGGTVTYGGLVDTLNNNATIEAKGTQTIDTSGGSLTMYGGGDATTYGGAFLSAPVQRLAFGDVHMTGGSSNVRDSDGFGAPAIIGNKDGADIVLTASSVTLSGGSGASSLVGIGSLTDATTGTTTTVTTTVNISATNFIEIDGNVGGVGIGNVFGAGSVANLAGNVYIGTGANIFSTANNFYSGIDISSYGNVTIDGTVAASSYGDVEITAGSGRTTGGNIHLGPHSQISGNTVSLYGYAGSNANGDIVQDSGGTITLASGYSYASSYFKADGDLRLNGTVSMPNGGYLYGYAGHSGATGKALYVANLSAPNGGNIQLYNTYGNAEVGTIAAPGGSVNIQAGGNLTQDSGGTITSGYVNIQAGGDVSINGTVTATPGGNAYGGVIITAGYNNSSTGGNLHLGSRSSITGGYVELSAYSGSVANGDIVQDSSGAVTITAGSYSSSFRATGDLRLNGTASLQNGGSLYSYAGDSGAAGKTLHVANLSAPNGGYIWLYNNGSGNAEIGKISAPGGTVNIQAGGSIQGFGSTPSTPNVTADVIYLSSQYGGTSGGATIVLDTAATSLLEATVSSGAQYGGIAIVNHGAAPAYVLLEDDSFAGNVSFKNTSDSTHTGDLTLGTSSTISTVPLMSFSANNGSVSVSSDGNLAVYDNGTYIYAPGGLTLKAGGNLDYYSNPNSTYYNMTNGGGLGLAAGGTLTIAPSAAATGTSVTIAAGSLNASGGAITATSGNVTSNVTNNITLSNGSYIDAGSDVFLTLGGATSTLSLSNASYIWARSPSTIHLNFTQRTSGGVVTDGSSGLYAGPNKTPATSGAGLDLAYYVPPVNLTSGATSSTTTAVINAITSTTNNNPNNNNPILGPVLLPSGGPSSSTPSGSQTAGGGAGQFGSGDSSSDSGDKKAGENNGKDNSGNSSGNNKDDSKSGSKKTLGHCSA